METESAILSFAALAQPTRLDVFRLLVKHEPQGLAAGDVARTLAVPQNPMSSVLAERKGRSIVYRANLAQLGGVVAFLMEDCCGGKAGLCAPATGKPGRGKRAVVPRDV
jgi:ArsR family transcriptional regulator